MKGCLGGIIATIVAALAALVVGSGVCFMGMYLADAWVTMLASFFVAIYVFNKIVIVMTHKESHTDHSALHDEVESSKSESDR